MVACDFPNSSTWCSPSPATALRLHVAWHFSHERCRHLICMNQSIIIYTPWLLTLQSYQPLSNVSVGSIFSLIIVNVYSLKFGSAVENHAVCRLVKINSFGRRNVLLPSLSPKCHCSLGQFCNFFS